MTTNTDKTEVAAAIAAAMDGEVVSALGRTMVTVTVRPKNSSRTFVATLELIQAEEV